MENSIIYVVIIAICFVAIILIACISKGSVHIKLTHGKTNVEIETKKENR